VNAFARLVGLIILALLDRRLESPARFSFTRNNPQTLLKNKKSCVLSTGEEISAWALRNARGSERPAPRVGPIEFGSTVAN
jgi:hypothetical protein